MRMCSPWKMEAYEMFEKAPGNVSVGSPMAFGMIADIGNVEFVLHTLLHRIDRHLGRNPVLIFCGSYGHVGDRDQGLLRHRQCRGTEKEQSFPGGKADSRCVALGIPLSRTRGSMIVNIGAQSTEISILADSRVIISRNLPIGGKQFNEAVCEQVRKQNSLLIGTRTARRLKIALASTDGRIREARMIMGMDSISGLPRKDAVTSQTVNEALLPKIRRLLLRSAIFWTGFPLRSAAILRQRASSLPGAVREYREFEQFFALLRQNRIRLSGYYESCTICGLKELINHETLQKYAFTARKKKK